MPSILDAKEVEVGSINTTAGSQLFLHNFLEDFPDSTISDEGK